MRRTFSLRDPGIRNILFKYGLDDAKPIGRGMFSAVYDCGDRVMKVTSDLAYVNFLDYCKGDFFPALYGRHREDSARLPIDVLEIEKLTPLHRAGAPVAKQGRRLVRAFNRAAFEEWRGRDWQRRRLAAMVEHAESTGDDDYVNAILDVEHFATNWIGALELDVHGANLMARGDHLVLTDMFADTQYLKAQGRIFVFCV
jgi:hypothetical protein